MSPLVLFLLVAVSVGAVGALVIPAFAGASRAGKRMKALRGAPGAARAAAGTAGQRSRDMRRRAVQDVLKAQEEEQKKKKRVPLQQQLHQAGMKLDKGVFIRNSVILGVVAFVVCFLLEVPIYFAAVFGLAAGYVLPRWYVGFKRKKFQSKFLDELPNAVEAIVRGVKSGLPLNDSIRVVAREVKEPVRSEFQRVLDQQAVGKSTPEAVMSIYERVPLPEVNFFVVVVTVQQQSGGNLSEALSNLSRVLRNRKKMQAKVKAMSSEAKASAYIIGSLPFIVGGLVSLVSPGYLAPLYTTPVGMICLGVAAVMMAFGIFVMNRMIQFDY